LVAEQILESVPPLLHPDERQAELDDRVPDDIEWRLIDEVDEDRRAVDDHAQAEAREARGQRVATLLDLDRERPGPLGERAERRGPEEPAALDRHDVVADPLDLAQQAR